MKSQYPQSGCGTASVLASHSAFTYAEIMLLIVIIGLLTVIWLLIVPRVSSGGRSRIQEARIQINVFKTALDMFNVDNGNYPSRFVGLSGLVRRPAGATNWHQYMDSVPLDPWGHNYIYKFPGDNNSDSFDLMSMGPDGKAGTKDDITNWQPRNEPRRDSIGRLYADRTNPADGHFDDSGGDCRAVDVEILDGADSGRRGATVVVADSLRSESRRF